MDTNILLENGTNELEILEFTVNGNYYGINVAKISEIIPYQRVTPVPNSHPSIEGIFMPRDKMITAISLMNCLGHGESQPGGLFIITNFNKLDVAFHVDDVLGIHRVSWTEIIKPGATVNNANEGLSTGIVKFDDKLIIILDFEKIVTDISPETGLKVADIDALGSRDNNNIPILIAEDSPLLNKLIVDSLRKAGFSKITSTENGEECYKRLEEAIENGSINSLAKIIITDIEMPIMDGHRLTKMVKTNPDMKEIPLIIFSSLINEEMRKKGEELGADAQLSKPEIGNLVHIIDELIDKTYN